MLPRDSLITDRVQLAIDFAESADDDEIRPHNMWQLQRMLTDMEPDDLLTTEIVALIAVLVPAHSRWLARRGCVRRQSPVLGGDAVTPVLRLIHT